MCSRVITSTGIVIVQDNESEERPDGRLISSTGVGIDIVQDNDQITDLKMDVFTVYQ